MTAVEFFAAARAHKRAMTGNSLDGLTQAEVDALNAIVGKWKRGTKPRGMSKEGIDLIHSFESCKLTAYPDPGSRDGHPWTIGWGSTGPDIGRGLTWTQEQCDERFARDLVKFENGVSEAIGDAETTQPMFDALVSFAYNVGLAALRTSTLLRKHKAGDHEGAAREFSRWNKNDGAVMRGLTRRRAAEEALYRKGMA
jgi:lysozyme